jgi:Family of unknown function (DUF6504)
MSGIDSEPAEVWERDGRPVRFVWRGRIYTVIFVRDRWQVPAEPTAGTMAGVECWRVEATAVRAVPPTVYELCHDLAADRWSLTAGL